jgi:hypothetical protein
MRYHTGRLKETNIKNWSSHRRNSYKSTHSTQRK